MKILIALLALMASPCFAWDLLQPTKLGIEAEKYDTLRDPYIPEDDGQWVYGAAMYAKFSLLGNREQHWRVFYDPKLHLRGDQNQVRQGGLYYEAGLEYMKDSGVRFFRRHQSDHVFERDSGANRKYPLLDSWVMQAEWEIK